MEDGDPEELIEQFEQEELGAPSMVFLPLQQEVTNLVALASPLETEANRVGPGFSRITTRV